MSTMLTVPSSFTRNNQGWLMGVVLTFPKRPSQKHLVSGAAFSMKVRCLVTEDGKAALSAPFPQMCLIEMWDYVLSATC